MTEVNQTKYYRIQNPVSGMYLLAGSWGKNPTDYTVWQYGLIQNDSSSLYDIDGFLWQIVPVSTDSENITWFRIINKVSGMHLCAGDWGTVPSDFSVKQFLPTYESENSSYDIDGFLWTFEEGSSGKIKNKASGRYLLAGSWGTVPSDNYVWQYALNQGTPNSHYNAGGFNWNIEPFSDVPTKTIFVSRKGQSNNIKLRDSEGHQGGHGNSGNDDDITTDVNHGFAVVWELDPNDHPVSLHSLNGIFKKSDSPADILVATPAFYSGQYQATIVRNPALDNQIETYNIKYQVVDGGEILEDDPKLKLNPITT